MQSPLDADDLTFTQQDLGRDEMVRSLERRTARARQPAVFTQPAAVVARVDGAATAVAELPWMVRDERPQEAHGWSMRQTDLMSRTSAATLRRLRDEAVSVSWKAAWLAVTSADDRLLRKREL